MLVDSLLLEAGGDDGSVCVCVGQSSIESVQFSCRVIGIKGEL